MCIRDRSLRVSEVKLCLLGALTKMDQQKFKQHCATKFCVKLHKPATVTYEKLQRTYRGHSLSRAQMYRWHKAFLESREV